MLSADDLIDLPNDPEMAFLVLEDRLRSKMGQAPNSVQKAEYMSSVRAFIHETGLDPYFDVNAEGYSNSFYYDDFSANINYFKTRLRVRNKVVFFSKPGETITVSDDYKDEIRVLLNRIRKIVQTAELEDGKRDSIFRKINELNDEVDQSSTRLGRFKAVWLDVTEAIGEGANKLEPAVKLLERIAGIFGKARAETEPLQLPAPESPRQLPAPDETEQQE